MNKKTVLRKRKEKKTNVLEKDDGRLKKREREERVHREVAVFWSLRLELNDENRNLPCTKSLIWLLGRWRRGVRTQNTYLSSFETLRVILYIYNSLILALKQEGEVHGARILIDLTLVRNIHYLHQRPWHTIDLILDIYNSLILASETWRRFARSQNTYWSSFGN